jgi:hypothetical protein
MSTSQKPKPLTAIMAAPAAATSAKTYPIPPKAVAPFQGSRPTAPRAMFRVEAG